MPKSITKIIITILVCAGMVFLLQTLKGFDLRGVAQAIHNISMPYLVGSVCLSLIQVWLQYWRYAILFSPAERPPARKLAKAVYVGQFLNSFTPMRAGDAYKVAASAHAHLPMVHAASVMLLERITDNIGLFTLAALGDYSVFLSSASKAAQGLSAASLAVAAVVLLVVLAVVLKFLPKLFAALRSFALHFQGRMFSKRFVVGAAVATFAWAVEVTSLCLLAHGMDLPLTISQICAAVLVLNIGIAVPLTVANVGVFEASLAFALVSFGAEPLKALAVASLHHLVLFATLAVWAGATLLRERLANEPPSEIPAKA